MPEYVYQSEDGDTISRVHSIRECPPLGHQITEDGKVYVRVVSPMQINGNPLSGRYPMVSRSLPTDIPGTEYTISKAGTPRAIIRDKAHAERICKEYGFTKEGDD